MVTWCCLTKRPGCQHYDLISHSVILSGHCLPYPNNAKCLDRKRQAYIFKSLVWLDSVSNQWVQISSQNGRQKLNSLVYTLDGATWHNMVKCWPWKFKSLVNGSAGSLRLLTVITYYIVWRRHKYKPAIWLGSFRDGLKQVSIGCHLLGPPSTMDKWQKSALITVGFLTLPQSTKPCHALSQSFIQWSSVGNSNCG